MKSNFPQDKIFPYFKQLLPGNGEDETSGIRLVTHALVKGLTLFYAVDIGNGFQIIQESMLVDWGLTEPQLFDIAIGNFANLLAGQLQVHGDSNGVMLTVDGNLEAGLVLMDDIWEQLEPQIGDTLVLAVPTRDVVMVTGENNEEFLQQMREKAREIYENGDHPLSELLYKRVDRKWEVFEPF